MAIGREPSGVQCDNRGGRKLRRSGEWEYRECSVCVYGYAHMCTHMCACVYFLLKKFTDNLQEVVNKQMPFIKKTKKTGTPSSLNKEKQWIANTHRIKQIVRVICLRLYKMCILRWGKHVLTIF